MTKEQFEEAIVYGDTRRIQQFGEEMVERMDKFIEMMKVQQDSVGYDEYMRGMYNGMEFARTVLEDDEPNYMEKEINEN